MATSFDGSQSPLKAHKLSEFIVAGKTLTEKYQYFDFSFIESIDGTEFIVKNIIDDYMDELKDISIEVQLSNEEKQKYLYNPKLLAYDLYGSTTLYWIILRLNNMINAHEFNLEKSSIFLLRKSDIVSSLQSIYNSEKSALNTYNSRHT